MEEVEVDVYDNDYYLWTMDEDILATMTEIPADRVHMGDEEVKMQKIVMMVSKKSCLCLMAPSNMKECLATFTKVDGQEA